MEAVVGLMLLLLRVSQGVETYCDGRQDRAQCYGALGGTVDVQLMDNTLDVHKYQWKKDQTVILGGRRKRILSNLLEDRSLFTPSNGTFRINNLSRNDGGEYELETYDSDGRRLEQRTLSLSVQGFIIINCTSSDGTHISQWVFAENNTLCVEPTTPSATVTEAHVSTVETYCDGRQDRAQCYGALGGTVDVQLMDRASGIRRYWWTKNRRLILYGKRNRFMSYLLEDRFFFTPTNGTFRINNLSRNDSGEYKLVFTRDSALKKQQQTLHLTIQAPVRSVLLLSECLSEGQMRASCSSEGGDSPQYSWTLDGHTLTHAELLSGNTESNSITLKQHVSGRLVCSVRNQVSRVSKEETITDCGFIFINCTSSDGTHISQWVFAENNTLCVEPTTPSATVTEAHVSTVESYCDGRQDRAQCYGALGGTVNVQLMDRPSGIRKYRWTKNRRLILYGKRNRFMSYLLEDRFFFTPTNGTFRINNLSRNDSGQYWLVLIDSEGKRQQRTLNLTIEAPVRSVLLLSECLSEGQMRASCSSEGGDSPQYSWTLDGHTLTHAELLSGNTESNSITLKQHVSGRLVCSVRNQVSRVSREETITDCKDLSLLICGLESAVAAVSLGFFYWKKRKYELLSSVAPQASEF